MTVGYRAILQLDESQDAIRVANEQLRSWLNEKVRDYRSTVTTADWQGPGRHALGPDTVLTVVEESSVDNRIRRIMLEAVEVNNKGTWTTRLYAMSDLGPHNSKQVLWIESEGERPHTRVAIAPATPRLVRNTLETVDAYDSTVPILSNPRIVRADDVDETFRFITDPNRRISIVIVAPIPGVPVHQWASAVTKISRDTVGCASFFVPDAEAAEMLNNRLGEAHRVPTGAIRTYVPSVEVDNPSDSRRHRILTPRTIEKSLDEQLRFDERLIRTIAVTPRAHLLEGALPTDLLRTARVLQNRLISMSVDTINTAVKQNADTDGPVQVLEIEHSEVSPPEPDGIEPVSTVSTPVPTPPRQPWLGRLKVLIKRVVGHETINEEALDALTARFTNQQSALETTTSTASKLQQERERLEDELTRLRQQVEDVSLDLAVAEDERRGAEKKVRSLEHWKAQRVDSYTYFDEPLDSWEAEPVNCVQIVERLIDNDDFGEVAKYVEFTSPEKAIDAANEIDEIDWGGQYASSFWEYILVLREYLIAVEAGFNGNVHMYLNSPDVLGRKCPPNRHKSNESETVQNNAKFRKERTFSVPSTVDASGKIFMSKHFAPTHRDQNAPRMYYEIDTQTTRKAYIGYMGVHLTNTKTN